MQSNYQKALGFVLQAEGNFSDVPGDSGGPTMHGITWREYDAFRQARGLPTQPVRDISDAEVDEIYKGSYWDRVDGDNLPGPIDVLMMDTAVNMGVGTAILMLQQAEGRPRTGVIDANMLAALKAKTPEECHAIGVTFCDLRAERYRAIAEDHSNDRQFENGWMNRLNDLRKLTGC